MMRNPTYNAEVAETVENSPRLGDASESDFYADAAAITEEGCERLVLVLSVVLQRTLGESVPRSLRSR